MSGDNGATLLVRGAHVHTLDGGPPARSLALAGDRVLVTGPEPSSLDHLAGPATAVMDLPGLCVLPGLGDAHVHQVEAEQDLGTVDVGAARTLGDVLAALRVAVRSAEPGSWVVTGRGWLESRLSERRLPTPAELDAVSTVQPIAVRRGSHLAVLNRAALALAPGLPVERDRGGRPTGLVRGQAVIRELLQRGAAPSVAGRGPAPSVAGRGPAPSVAGRGPAPSVAGRAAALADVCRLHASRGLVWVRDAGVTVEEVEVYRHLAARGGLPVRSDVLVALPRGAAVTETLGLLDDLGPAPGPEGDRLHVNGVKLYVDGHVADAALREAGRARPTVYLDAPSLTAITARAVELGWRVGCHAVGDRALDITLDAFEGVLRTRPDLPAGWLAVEHACVADEAQRGRAAALGVGITVQHPLLYAYGGAMLEHWGPERTAAASPARSWVASGALVAAGTDGHVVPWDPLLSVWGLVTRGTLDVGVQGPGEALTLTEALRLYTTSARWLSPWRGSGARALATGDPADLVAFERCPFEVEVDDLPNLAPVLTIVGGHPVHVGAGWDGAWPADAPGPR